MRLTALLTFMTMLAAATRVCSIQILRDLVVPICSDMQTHSADLLSFTLGAANWNPPPLARNGVWSLTVDPLAFSSSDLPHMLAAIPRTQQADPSSQATQHATDEVQLMLPAADEVEFIVLVSRPHAVV